MRLRTHAPRQIIFLISLILAIIGVLGAVTTVIILPIAPLWWVVVAYILLAIGVTMRGL